jgi:hypothetical protein
MAGEQRAERRGVAEDPVTPSPGRRSCVSNVGFVLDKLVRYGGVNLLSHFSVNYAMAEPNKIETPVSLFTRGVRHLFITIVRVACTWYGR